MSLEFFPLWIKMMKIKSVVPYYSRRPFSRKFGNWKKKVVVFFEKAQVSRPGLVFQRATTEIKYYYYLYSNFTSDFFLTCSNYTCISLVKYSSTSVLLQLGNSHICDSHKRLSVSNISSSNSDRTMRSPPQSYIYITIIKQLAE